MDEYVIESLINFCDDMLINNDIATEGVKEIGKSVWEGIKRIFRKIVNWFQNIIRSINYFKNATLDSDLNKDLVEVLKISQPKTELNFQWVTYYYKLANNLQTNNNGEHEILGTAMGEASGLFGLPHATTIEDQIKRCVYDIDSSLKAAEESPAKKRIDANEYKNENLVTIPLGQITSDLKKSYSSSVKAENELSRIDNASTKLMTFTKGKELVSKAHVFYSKLSQYYKFRIDILSKFLNYAKASLKGTVANVKDRLGKDNRIKTNYKPSWKISIKLKSKAEVDDIMQTYEKAKSAQTYQEYLPLYKKLASIFKCDGPISGINKESDNQITAMLTKEGVSYPIGNQKLYHHSMSITPIKELIPRWKTNTGVLFPTPRVYFHINVPLNRYSHKLDSNNKTNLYTPSIKIDKVFVDKELSRTACYVETNKPIPVKPVDYSQWEKVKDVELGLSNDK